MNDAEALKARLMSHEKELASFIDAHTRERREMQSYLKQLNDNLMSLTTAVTEWKTNGAMYEKRISKTEDEVSELRSTVHKLELEVVAVKAQSNNSSGILEKYSTVILKILSSVIVLAIVGGLAYKLGGGP